MADDRIADWNRVFEQQSATSEPTRVPDSEPIL